MYISTPKTKQAYRLIRLDDITFSELKQWRRQQKKELLKYGIRIHSGDKQHIFHRKNNTVLYPEYINDLLSDKLKVDFTPHSFRHTHASLLFESGASLKDVQARLGHTDVRMTMDIYTHVTKTAERKP
ncbi:tyrosine-type recombinase/integrase [uncultured Vagococcus sp.]|uniref:tyrosine-type recombinase/integrase n=1 Tax=uncultured Vagococcus sp. TaxID=189676 RepID=UPI0028D88DC6|nr:tyrosine-type recombinase/integrase [uncultured Vagococcus sp.]